MIKMMLSSSRYVMIIPVLGTFFGFLALMFYEIIVLANAVFETIQNPSVSTKAVKVFAVGVVEAVDVFLIAIAVNIISLGLYSLFIDDSITLPKWMQIRSLDDLKANLISVVIAVLSVLFLREAVAWEGNSNILAFGAALALMVAALTFYLMKTKSPDETPTDESPASHP